MATYTLDEIREIVGPIALRHGVKSVALFGSYSKGTATPESDVDIKIEKGKLRTLYQLAGFRLEIEDALKLPVDMITSEASDKRFLEMISKDEVRIYESA